VDHDSVGEAELETAPVDDAQTVTLTDGERDPERLLLGDRDALLHAETDDEELTQPEPENDARSE
jgi:hypothetical protein